jgi:hypothetical protein
VSKPAIVIPDSLLERMARAGFEEIVRRKKGLIDPDGPTWETQSESVREDYLAIARAIQQSLDERGSNVVATAYGDGEGMRKSVMPFIASAVVLVLLGAAGVAWWTAGWSGFPSLPGLDRASPAMSKAALIDPSPRRPEVEATAASSAGPEVPAPIPHAAAQDPAASPSPLPSPAPPPPPSSSQREAGSSDLAAPAAEKPEPQKTTCTVEFDLWPADGASQGKAIQILLRELGFYSGTTYGTVGPATRAAIRKFQLAANEAETGEPSKMLFESLKRRMCASSAP